MPPSSPHTRGPRRLATTLYAYAFLTDLVLLYPVFALLFRESGLTVGQITTLFVIWTAAGVVVEIPSGALADVVSRRLLLVLAPLLTAVGHALWVLLPSYPVFAVGFVLWGAAGALRSGALQALVWTELDRLGAVDRYARVAGRARTAEVLGVVCAMGLAGPVLAVGGYRAVGAASVLAGLLTATVALRFPGHPPAPCHVARLGWVGNLRAGLAEARADPRVRAGVLLVPAVTAVWGALDEYTPLLAVETGVTEVAVPLLLLLVWAGASIGGLLAPAAEHLGDRGYALLLAVAALALAGGVALRHPAGFVLVAVAFGGFQLTTVLADARLQARITGSSRATVTSLAGMATCLALLAVYGGYALAATAYGHRGAFLLAAVPYLVVAVLVARPGRRRTRPRQPPPVREYTSPSAPSTG